ncbi:MAG: hypothetical protein DRP71_12885 [Verrucomicrobia bacterium]|nr:MAG: hypothetical protein DRP71_12885 [Verrucomicrobiota bacterium]
MSSTIRLAVLLVIFGVASSARADVSMSSLQSLPAVGVKVMGLPASADAFALVEDDISDFVGRILDRNGVPVIGAEGFDAHKGDPVLEVTLTLVKVRGPSHLYTIDLELRELVVPVRELKSLVEIPAVTWKRQTAGIANRGSTVLDSLEKMVEDFGTEFRREN